MYVYDNEVRIEVGGGSKTVGTYSSHWAAVAAMVRYKQPDFRSLGGDAAGDLTEEMRMKTRIDQAYKHCAAPIGVYDTGPICQQMLIIPLLSKDRS